jgi:hypothetical protein
MLAAGEHHFKYFCYEYLIYVFLILFYFPQKSTGRGLSPRVSAHMNVERQNTSLLSDVTDIKYSRNEKVDF